MMSIRVGWLMVLVSLVGCASVPPVPVAAVPAEVTPEARQAERLRQRQVAAQLDWGFAGRIAVSNGRDGGTGRLEWHQDGAGFQARLSAPITRQGWELQVDAVTGWARLDGLPGGPRAAADASQLVWEATGWYLPVMSMGDWVRGVTGVQAHVLAEDALGRPLRASQDGWEVTFTQWHDAQEGQPALPKRIDAVQGQARVRLLVDQWSGWEP